MSTFVYNRQAQLSHLGDLLDDTYLDLVQELNEDYIEARIMLLQAKIALICHHLAGVY